MDVKGNKVLVTVMGSKYAIVSGEEPAYVQELARRLDDSIKQILEADDRTSLVAAAIVCAMSYQNELLKQTASADNLRVQIKDYLEDFNKARIEVEELKRHAEHLKRENASLRDQLAKKGAQK